MQLYQPQPLFFGRFHPCSEDQDPLRLWYSVALGSGGPEAKAAADYVTDDVDKDGLYNAFVHLGLI